MLSSSSTRCLLVNASTLEPNGVALPTTFDATKENGTVSAMDASHVNGSIAANREVGSMDAVKRAESTDSIKKVGNKVGRIGTDRNANRTLETIKASGMTPVNAIFEGCKDVTIGQKVFNINVDNREKVKEVNVGAWIARVASDSSCAERGACAVATIFVVACCTVAVCFTSRSGAESPDDLFGWYVNRSEWLAESTMLESDGAILPAGVPLIIINHSASQACQTFLLCAAEMRFIQDDWVHIRGMLDGPYNFAIGTDGRVYEARGWKYVGAHTKSYNMCSIGIGFLGDYRSSGGGTVPTEKQKESMYRLLDIGVRSGYIRPDYKLQGHRDLRSSESPGDILYEQLRRWPQYDDLHIYRDHNCSQIMQDSTSKG